MKQCRVYRVRTTGYTVRHNQWGPKPHTRGSILYSTDMSQIENTIIIIFVNTYVEGETFINHYPFIHYSTFIGL